MFVCVCVCVCFSNYIYFIFVDYENESFIILYLSIGHLWRISTLVFEQNRFLIFIIIVIIILFSTTNDSSQSVRIKRTKSVCYTQTFIWPLLTFYSELLAGFLVDIQYLVFIKYLVYIQYLVYINIWFTNNIWFKYIIWFTYNIWLTYNISRGVRCFFWMLFYSCIYIC